MSKERLKTHESNLTEQSLNKNKDKLEIKLNENTSRTNNEKHSRASSFIEVNLTNKDIYKNILVDLSINENNNTNNLNIINRIHNSSLEKNKSNSDNIIRSKNNIKANYISDRNEKSFDYPLLDKKINNSNSLNNNQSFGNKEMQEIIKKSKNDKQALNYKENENNKNFSSFSSNINKNNNQKLTYSKTINNNKYYDINQTKDFRSNTFSKKKELSSSLLLNNTQNIGNIEEEMFDLPLNCFLNTGNLTKRRHNANNNSLVGNISNHSSKSENNNKNVYNGLKKDNFALKIEKKPLIIEEKPINNDYLEIKSQIGKYYSKVVNGNNINSNNNLSPSSSIINFERKKTEKNKTYSLNNKINKK